MNTFKFSKLLSYLLAPFMMMAVEDEGGGAAPSAADLAAKEEAAAVERGDVIVDPAKVAADAAAAGAKPEDPLATDEAKAAEAAAQAEKDKTDADAAALAEAEKDFTDEQKADAAAAREAAAAEKADKADKSKGKDTRIPLARHEATLAKVREERDAIAARLAAVEQGKAVTVINDDIKKGEEKLGVLEGEYNELIANGDAAKATAKMKEIRELDRQINTQRTDLATSAAETRAVERVRFDSTVTAMEAAYPTVQPDHPDYDQAKVDEVLDLMNRFKLADPTLSPSAALRDAVKYALGEPTKATKAADTPADAADDKAAKAAAVEAQRKADAIKRGLEAAKAQPASTVGVGTNSDDAGKLTPERVTGMSQKEFNKLDEKDLAVLRGDVIA